MVCWGETISDSDFCGIKVAWVCWRDWLVASANWPESDTGVTRTWPSCSVNRLPLLKRFWDTPGESSIIWYCGGRTQGSEPDVAWLAWTNWIPEVANWFATSPLFWLASMICEASMTWTSAFPERSNDSSLTAVWSIYKNRLKYQTYATFMSFLKNLWCRNSRMHSFRFTFS